MPHHLCNQFNHKLQHHLTIELDLKHFEWLSLHPHNHPSRARDERDVASMNLYLVTPVCFRDEPNNLKPLGSQRTIAFCDSVTA
jgi:hypothetical protein